MAKTSAVERNKKRERMVKQQAARRSRLKDAACDESLPLEERFAAGLKLEYHEGQPVIREIARVSKPGRRVYSKVTDLPRVFNGLGISILSTPRGVMSDSEARAANVGGEILCRVF